VQRSGATPHFAATTTTPVGARFHGKPEQRKDIVGIVAAHNIPYVATASVGNIPDLKKKLLKVRAIRGSSFIVIYSTCTLGWRFDPAQTIKVAKLAIDTGAWPLYEIEKGKTTINVEPKWTPLEEYLKLQRRFKHMTKEEIDELQKEIKASWDALKKASQ
jgi:pyruvate ferredoxin oxidoreductase beta subunit